MDEARAEDEEYAWLKEPLPERPALGPIGTWPSSRPVTVLATQFGPSAIWVAFVLAGGFGSAGTSYFWMLMLVIVPLATGADAVVRRILRRRAARLCATTPGEPWRHDHPWDERGEARSWFVRMAERTSGGSPRRRILPSLLLGTFICLAIGGAWLPATAVGGALLTSLTWAAWRLHGTGDTRLHFAKFPFHPGERVTLFFGMEPGGAQFRRVEFHLCQVKQGRWKSGIRLRRITERRPPGALPGSDFDVEVSFDVPARAPGTNLVTAHPEYWVLDVVAATSAGPYAETFLIPIYERPAAAARDQKLPA